jgi:hypothetical protein
MLLATQVNNPLVGAGTALASAPADATVKYEVSLQTNTASADNIVVVASNVRKPDYEAEVLAPLHAAQAAAAAKAAADAAAAKVAATATVVYSTVVAPPPAGSHTDWMAAAGIAESDYGYVEYILSSESGWGVTKWNYSGSGAYGLGQALPASKMAAYGADYMTNPVTQLKWATSYAVSRYGSWANAYAFWTSNRWW